LRELINRALSNVHENLELYLDCFLFALREVPQASTGVPPWVMAFGYLPRRSCAIQKDSRVNEEEFPLDLGKSVMEYLEDLRGKLQVGNEFAIAHTQRTQQK
jgi:hypothetical protein